MQALRSSESYDGFECLRWQRDGEHLLFDAYNFEGGCHVNWRGDAERTGQGKLQLVLSNPSCILAGCGSCLYDASFDIDLATTPLDDSAKVPLIQAPCEGDRSTVGSWQLQAGDDDGISCKYARGLDWHASRLNDCGKMNMPCRGNGLCGSRPGGPAPEPCDEGLTCTPVGDAGSMCLKNCASSDECPLSDVLECRDDVCQLK